MKAPPVPMESLETLRERLWGLARPPHRRADRARLLSEIEAAVGRPRIGTGSTRVVFGLSPSAVLKVARDRRGFRDNAFEARRWTYYRDLCPTLLAHVLASDPQGLWLVQERVAILEAPARRETQRVASALTAIDPQNGVYVDSNFRNFGRRPDAQLVLVDLPDLWVPGEGNVWSQDGCPGEAQAQGGPPANAPAPTAP